MLRKLFLGFALLSTEALSQPQPFASSFAPTPYGRFVGTLLLVPDGAGGRMRLQAPYQYIDPAGGTWLAPAGTISDGASVPKFAKSFVGGGWDGRYLHAAVIHDVACVEKKRPWELVHLTFYNAMLASGVGTSTAKIMYAAVYHFGPRWALGGDTRKPPPGGWSAARANTKTKPSQSPSCLGDGGFLGSICIPDLRIPNPGRTAKEMDEVNRAIGETHPKAVDAVTQEMEDSAAFSRLVQEININEMNGKSLSVEEIQNLK